MTIVRDGENASFIFIESTQTHSPLSPIHNFTILSSSPNNTRLLAPLSAAEPAWPLLMAVALVHHATAGSPGVQLAVHPDQPGLGEALDHLRAVQEIDRVVQTILVAIPAQLWPKCDAIISLASESSGNKKILPGIATQPPLISPSPIANHRAASTKPRDLAAAIHAWLLATPSVESV